MNIPEHPDVECTLKTGYPHPAMQCVRCCDCEAPLVDEEAYDWDGDTLCESCVKDRIEENYGISDIADALGIRHAMASLPYR